MGLIRRSPVGGAGGAATVTSNSIATALSSALPSDLDQIKNHLSISGFSYSGTGAFVFYGDEIQTLNSTGKNIYQLDGGSDF
jgi:S-formylglutathione hydrolase FrmB